MQNQIYVFTIFILYGFLIGIIFDCFRVLRKSFKTPDFITYMEDILFGIITAFLILYGLFNFNNGELRFYLFLGIFIGLSLYLSIFSKVFIKICVHIILFFKNIIYYLLIKPIKLIIKLLKKIFFKPIVFICINSKQIFNKIKKPIYKVKHKNAKKK